MAIVPNVLRVERQAVREEELETALKRILSVPGFYDGDEIVRILGAPSYGFELNTPDEQSSCFALLTKILRENHCLQIGLIRERNRFKLSILSYRSRT